MKECSDKIEDQKKTSFQCNFIQDNLSNLTNEPISMLTFSFDVGFKI